MPEANRNVMPSSPLRSPWFIAAFVAMMVSRIVLFGWFEPLYTDVTTYFSYAINGVDLHLVPYRDVPIEYPPLAYAAVALPRWLSTPVPRGLLESPLAHDLFLEYVREFRLEMLAADVAAFVLLLLIVRRRRPELLAAAAWGYVLVTTLSAHVLFDRFDAGLSMLILLWAWSWLRVDGSRRPGVWQVIAYAALGLGFAYKLVPLVVLPLVMMADLRAIGRRTDAGRAAIACLACALAGLGPFAWYYRQAGASLWKMFTFHQERGLEIESLWASVAMLLHPLGLELQAKNGFGCWNVVTPADPALLLASNVTIGVLLAVAGLRACWPTMPFTRTDAYRWGLFVLAGMLVLPKVLSAQYLVWGLPVILLLGAELFTRRQYGVLIGLLVPVAGLTAAVFPYLFFRTVMIAGRVRENLHSLVPELDWLPCTLLVVRNAILLGVFAWLAATIFARWKSRAGRATMAA
jgi:hypothetical protein